MTIRILPSFWVMVGLVSMFMASNSFILFFLIALSVLASVLVHEIGHAFMLKIFKRSASIELTGYGGTTYGSHALLSLKKNFLVVIGGPLFGYGAFFIASILSQYTQDGSLAAQFLSIFGGLNFFWSNMNLLPVLPLDGGKCLMIICEAVSPKKKYVTSFFLSGVFSILLAIFFLSGGQVFIAAVFLLFGFESYSGWKYAKDEKENEEVVLELIKAGEDWQQQNPHKAIERLEACLQKEKHLAPAIVERISSYHLFLGEPKKAYVRLHSVKERLTPQGQKLLQLACYQLGEFGEALEVGRRVFIELLDFEVALINAFSAAQLNFISETVRWLERVKEMRAVDLQSILAADDFIDIRKKPEFEQELKSVFKF